MAEDPSSSSVTNVPKRFPALRTYATRKEHSPHIQMTVLSGAFPCKDPKASRSNRDDPFDGRHERERGRDQSNEGRHARAASVFEQKAMSPSSSPSSHNIVWGIPERSPQRPRNHLARVASALVWAFCGLAAVAVYTNVLADDSAVRQKTELLARQHAGCGDQCHVARMEGRRSVLDYRASYEIDGVGTQQIVCRRSVLVLGEHICTAR
ncbi:MAG: hypothetical protein K0S65_617 [Labilithrix sp.]|nr:hypothetical protein [Labilithrix sp.]